MGGQSLSYRSPPCFYVEASLDVSQHNSEHRQDTERSDRKASPGSLDLTVPEASLVS